MDPDPALDKASAYPQNPAPDQEAPPHPPTSPGAAQNELRWSVFLEPRGFLRFIEFILAVCMFATTAGYATSITFSVSCDAQNATYTFAARYPFNLGAKPLPSFCNDTTSRYAATDPSSSAQFFVAVGVLAMLYTLGIGVWYVAFEAKFLDKPVQYTVDFVATAVFAVLFFIASCAWAAGLNDVKYWTDFTKLINNKLAYQDTCGQPHITCELDEAANYASLNVSILFGFLNVVVWGGNLWFIYKETSWFRARSAGKAASEQPQANPNTV